MCGGGVRARRCYGHILRMCDSYACRLLDSVNSCATIEALKLVSLRARARCPMSRNSRLASLRRRAQRDATNKQRRGASQRGVRATQLIHVAGVARQTCTARALRGRMPRLAANICGSRSISQLASNTPPLGALCCVTARAARMRGLIEHVMLATQCRCLNPVVYQRHGAVN